MNTLNKKYTTTFFKDPSNYDKMVLRWKLLVNSPEGKTLQANEHWYYLVLRGKNYKKAFYPGKYLGETKLPYGLHCAKYCQWSFRFKDLFGDLLVSDWESKIRKITDSVNEENDAYNDDNVNLLLVTETENKSIITRIKTAIGIK